MRIAYFDCFAGASGNMILGSLIDAGLNPDDLRVELEKLHVSGYEIKVEKVTRQGIAGTHAVVALDKPIHEHRNISHIEAIIEKSDLPESVKSTSMLIFRRLAQAEARVHRVPIEEIHFHEVGAVDAIVDVVGSVVGLAELGIQRIYCSPVQLGCGFVESDHGTLPVPAPATAELIKGAPVYSNGVQGELLTPTGAAILTTVGSWIGAMPEMTIDQIGYGAGSLQLSIPNLLRLVIGDDQYSDQGHLADIIVVMETNIDDMNPQIYDFVMEELFKIGVLDVFLTNTHMKKGRPGTLLTVTCPPTLRLECASLIMAQTTAIGLRWRLEKRMKSHRFIEEHETCYGPVRFKFAQFNGKTVNVSPEYEDCKRIAVENKIPLKLVMQEACLTAAAISKSV